MLRVQNLYREGDAFLFTLKILITKLSLNNLHHTRHLSIVTFSVEVVNCSLNPWILDIRDKRFLKFRNG